MVFSLLPFTVCIWILYCLQCYGVETVMDVRTITRQSDSCHIVWFYLRLENCHRFGLPEEYLVIIVNLVFLIVFLPFFWVNGWMLSQMYRFTKRLKSNLKKNNIWYIKGSQCAKYMRKSWVTTMVFNLRGRIGYILYYILHISSRYTYIRIVVVILKLSIEDWI